MSNWYDNPNIVSERIILTKDIIFTVPKDIQAEFLVPILTPTMDTTSGNAENREVRPPSTRSQNKVNKVSVEKYTSSNCIILTIPKYIVAEFFDEFLLQNYIPKGTIFIMSSIGESLKIDNMRITGYFKLGEEEQQ